MCILTHLAPLHADNAWSACTTSVRWNGRGSEVRLNTTISRQRLQKRKKKSHSRHWEEYILDHSIGTFESIIKLALRCVYNIFLYVQIVQKCYYNIMNVACVYIVVSENIKVKWINSIFIWQGNKKHFIQFFDSTKKRFVGTAFDCICEETIISAFIPNEIVFACEFAYESNLSRFCLFSVYNIILSSRVFCILFIFSILHVKYKYLINHCLSSIAFHLLIENNNDKQNGCLPK